MWHLPTSYNRDLFARIFPTCPMVLGNAMQSLKLCYLHRAKTDPCRAASASIFGSTSDLYFMHIVNKLNHVWGKFLKLGHFLIENTYILKFTAKKELFLFLSGSLYDDYLLSYNFLGSGPEGDKVL